MRVVFNDGKAYLFYNDIYIDLLTELDAVSGNYFAFFENNHDLFANYSNPTRDVNIVYSNERHPTQPLYHEDA